MNDRPSNEPQRARFRAYLDSLREPRGACVLAFGVTVLLLLVRAIARRGTHPFAYVDYDWYESWNFTWLVVMNPLAWIGLPMLLVTLLVVDPWRRFSLRALPGMAIGLLFGALVFRTDTDAAIVDFVIETRPLVAAIDAYAEDHTVPPADLMQLVPAYLDELPSRLPPLALRQGDGGWWYEYEIVCTVFAYQKLVLRPAAARGSYPNTHLELFEALGPWERHYIN